MINNSLPGNLPVIGVNSCTRLHEIDQYAAVRPVQDTRWHP
jgi:hypothetical protein